MQQDTIDRNQREAIATSEPPIHQTIPLTSISFDALTYFLILPRNAIYLCAATPLFRSASSDSPDLLDLPRFIFCEGSTTFHLKHGANFSVNIVSSSSKNASITVQDQTLFTSFSQHFSLGIRKYIEEKDFGIFLLLDANYLKKQLGHMQPSNPIINEAIRILTSSTQVQLDEMLGVANTQNELTPSEMIGPALIEEAREVTYTGVDNLLFAKAYTHMTDILKKILQASEQHINHNAPSITAIRQLFCTKKPYLMAMITFLAACHQVAASEEQKLIGKNPSTEDLVAIDDHEITVITGNSRSNLVVPRPEGKPELLKLIGVDNDEELLALDNGTFNEKVKKISSFKTRGRIRDLRIDLQSIIEEQKEREAAKARRKQREEELDRFYQEAVITDVKEDNYGNVIWAKITCSDEVAALLEGGKKWEGNLEGNIE